MATSIQPRLAPLARTLLLALSILLTEGSANLSAAAAQEGVSGASSSNVIDWQGLYSPSLQLPAVDPLLVGPSSCKLVKPDSLGHRRRLLQSVQQEEQKLNELNDFLFSLGVNLVSPAAGNLTLFPNVTLRTVPLGQVITVPTPDYPPSDPYNKLVGQSISLSAVRLNSTDFLQRGFSYQGTSIGAGRNFSFAIPGGGLYASGSCNILPSTELLYSQTSVTDSLHNVTLVWFSLGPNQPFTTDLSITSPIETLQVFDGDVPPNPLLPPPGTLGSQLEMFWNDHVDPVSYSFPNVLLGNITCARYDLSEQGDLKTSPIVTTLNSTAETLSNCNISTQPLWTTVNASLSPDGYAPYGKPPVCTTRVLGSKCGYVFLTGNSGCEFDISIKYDLCQCDYCSKHPCDPKCMQPSPFSAAQTAANVISFNASGGDFGAQQLCCPLARPVCQLPGYRRSPNLNKCCRGKENTLEPGFCCCAPKPKCLPPWWAIFLLVLFAVLFLLTCCCLCLAGGLLRRSVCDHRFEEVQTIRYVQVEHDFEETVEDKCAAHEREEHVTYKVRKEGKHCQVSDQNVDEWNAFHDHYAAMKEHTRVRIMEVKCHRYGRTHQHKCVLDEAKQEHDFLGHHVPIAHDEESQITACENDGKESFEAATAGRLHSNGRAYACK